MTTYVEDTGEKVIDGATVPAGRVLEVTRVNGTLIDRLNGFPVNVAMPKGTIVVYLDGTCRYDDAGVITGHPALGITAANGTFTTTLGYSLFAADGSVTAIIESAAQTWTVSLTGIVADTTAPVLVGLNPANGSTAAARDTIVTLTFSKPVQFGTGLVTLRNVTGAVDIETFDVVTKVGTGLGQINVSGSEVRLKATAALPASAVVSVRVATTAIKDLANNAFAGLAADTQSFTTASAAPISTATYYFGALTPQGQAGIPATSLVDPSGHFVLTAGRVVVSATGDAVNLASGPYPVTMSGAEVTIEAVPNAISVSNLSQATAAIASFQASPTVDSTVLMRNGDDWAFTNNTHVTLGAAGMGGVFFDANCTGFATSATAQTYNADAVASLTGGSITVRPDTPLGATIRAWIRPHSNANIVFNGVVFESVPTEDARSLTEGGVIIVGANNIPVQTTTAMVLIGGSTPLPTGTAIFKNCVFGGKRFGTPLTRWGSYLRASGAGHFVVEDCTFDGYFNAISGGESRHYVVRRNLSQRKIADFSRCFNVRSAITGSTSTPVYCEIVKNTEYNMIGSTAGDGGFHFAAYHSDFSQCGANAEEVDVAMTSAYNIHLGEVDRSDPTALIQGYYNGTNGRPNLSTFDFSTYPRRRSQAIFANYQTTGKGRFGTCYKDTMIGNLYHAYTNGGFCRMDLINCLFPQGMGNFDNALGSSINWALRLGTGVNNVVQNTIYMTGSATAGYTFANNAILNRNPTGPQSYAENFAGTFANGVYGPQILFNTTGGMAAFRADVQAKLSSRAGSLAAGKGPWA